MVAAGQYAGGVILALDVATRTGVAWGAPGETPQTATVDFGKPLPSLTAPTGKDQTDLFGRTLRWAASHLHHGYQHHIPAKLVILEGLVPQYDKTLQCGMHAIFQAVAAAKGIPVMIAPIFTWRKFVLGDAKLKKEMAKTRAVQKVTRLGWDVDSHDAAEAACIWLWGCAQVAPDKAHRAEPLFLGGAP